MANFRINLKRIAFAIALLSGAGSTASAQLVFGSTTTSTSNPAAFYLDVTTGQITTLWNSAANKKVNGLAADQANGRLYANDAARLNFWDYGSIGIVPTFIAGMYRSNGTTTSATGFDALAWANGALYGATSFASSTFTRGIYRIPLVPNGSNQLITTQVWSDPDPTGTLVLGGLDFNPENNLFYATQTTDSTGGGGFLTPGIYTIDVFGNGAFTRIADLPAGATRADGLAVGGGKLWITQQQTAQNQISIYPFDLATMTYGTTINVPLTDGTNRATGATWAPGALTAVPHSLVSILRQSSIDGGGTGIEHTSASTTALYDDFDQSFSRTGNPGYVSQYLISQHSGAANTGFVLSTSSSGSATSGDLASISTQTYFNLGFYVDHPAVLTLSVNYPHPIRQGFTFSARVRNGNELGPPTEIFFSYSGGQTPGSFVATYHLVPDANVGYQLTLDDGGDVDAFGQLPRSFSFNGSFTATLSAAPAMQLLSAVSRKTHGGAGDFDIALPLTGEPGVECRQTSGNQTIIATFSNQPVSGSASVTSGVGSLAGTPVFSGNTMTVNLTGVTDIQKVMLTLSNVTDEFSQVMADTSLSVNILAGDTNGNKVVNTTDIAQTKSGSGAPVTAANFKSDVNANGTINTTDIGQVKANAGNTLP